MTLVDPRTSINEVLAIVTALTLPLSFADPAQKAFEKVKIFDLEELNTALQELFVVHNRVAFIGIDAIFQSSSIAGRKLEVSRALGLTIIASDRRFSDRQRALMGDTTTPGALLLQTLLVEALSCGLPSGAVCQPEDGRLVKLQSKERDDGTGRIIFAQDFTVNFDWINVPLDRGAILTSAR